MDVEFDQFILDLRQNRALSQSDLARAVDVHRSRVSEWEAGKAVPNPLTLERLAERFGLDLDALMRACGYRTRAPIAAADADELELLVTYRRITSPDKRVAAKEMLYGLAGRPVQPTRAKRPIRPNANRPGEHLPQLGEEHGQDGQEGTSGTITARLHRHGMALVAPVQDALLQLCGRLPAFSSAS